MTGPLSFPQQFAELPDPRSHVNRTYELLDIALLTVCAGLCGAEGWKDIEKFGHKKPAWLRRFRRFEAGIPVAGTITRIIRGLVKRFPGERESPSEPSGAGRLGGCRRPGQGGDRGGQGQHPIHRQRGALDHAPRPTARTESTAPRGLPPGASQRRAPY